MKIGFPNERRRIDSEIRKTSSERESKREEKIDRITCSPPKRIQYVADCKFALVELSKLRLQQRIQNENEKKNEN